MCVDVVCRAQYIAEAVTMRGVDYDALHLVKAVKGLALHPNSYCYVTVDSERRKITEESKNDALEWFAEWASQHIDNLGVSPVALVPVPAHDAIVGSRGTFRTALISEAISRVCGVKAEVAPILRWRQEITPSRSGGPREPTILYPNLVLDGSLPSQQVVLIDDVISTGGHLKAAAWRVEDAGGTINLAICCGRTLYHQLNDPFEVPPESLDLSRPSAVL